MGTENGTVAYYLSIVKSHISIFPSHLYQSFVLLLSQLPFLADIWHGSQSAVGSQPKSRKVVRHQWRRINESWKKTDRSELEKPMIWQTFRYFTTDEKALFEASMERLRKGKLRGIIS